VYKFVYCGISFICSSLTFFSHFDVHLVEHVDLQFSIWIDGRSVILKYAGTMAPTAPMAPILLVVGGAKVELA